jgi:phytoene dehydrogenase-like protein
MLSIERSTTLDTLAHRVEDGWGAAMMYLGLTRDAPVGNAAKHLELVGDVDRPFIEGNHVFVSLSAHDEDNRGPDGGRTVTASTHVPMKKLLAFGPDARAAYVREVQTAMRSLIAARAPEVLACVAHEETASPRTFARFTARPDGYVGGIPRRAGMHNYRAMGPTEVAERVYLVGDTVFPGQSTLATALGGRRTAEHLLLTQQ